MLKIISSALICVICFLETNAQSLDQKEIYHLQATIINFLYAQDNIPNANTKRSSEFIVCLLQIDSIGKIKSIQLFADNGNKDSVFIYLNRITTSVFKDWKSERCKGKTILMPIVAISHGKSPDYMNNLIDKRYIKPIAVISETDKLIVITPIQYTPPYDEWENPPIQAMRIDTIKKKN